MATQWLFTALYDELGAELWISDGTTAGTLPLKDIWVGGNSYVYDLRSLGNGKILFAASDAVNGNELWVTDGTSAGTVLVKDINPGTGYAGISNLTPVGGGKAIFTASNPTYGNEIWITDGTAAGTLLVKDSVSGTGSFNPYGFVSMGNGKALFTADFAGYSNELGITDGTAAGTYMLKDIDTGVNGSGPSGFTDLGNGQFFFRANNGAGVNGNEPWVTDGTLAGTMMVKDINPGTASSDIDKITYLGNGKVLFRAKTATYGYELWVSDGTSAGTSLVKDVNVGTGNFEISLNPTSMGDGRALFSGFTSSAGYEPWITDGTSAGTFMIKNLASGSAHSSPTQFTSIGNGKFVFSASNGNAVNGPELWVTDGTSAGTLMVKDINPGTAGSNLQSFSSLGNGQAVFLATDPVYGRAWWITDGTAAGTLLLKDINTVSNASDPGGSTFVPLDEVAANTAPELTGPQAVLTNGTEDTAYTLTLAQLLAGFSDLDGDTLGVANLTADHGILADNGNDTWTLTPDADYYGAVQLDYDVVDGQGGSIAGSLSLTLDGVIDQYTITGSGNADVIRGDDLNPGAADVLSGAGGDDQLFGFGGNDRLYGGANNDILDGGEGADYMDGGTGDDTYVVDNLGDVVNEPLTNSGVDTIISKLSSFTLVYSTMDNLVLGAGALNGTGNWISNVITGNEQNNILHGGDGNDTIHGLGGNDQLWGDAGADAMYGGQGDDSYYVDNAGDSLIELAGEGIDRVSSSVNHTLGFDLEHLTLTGSAVIGIGNALDNQLTGNNANNQLQGNGGQDMLDGKAGADQMAGGQGDDFYYVDNAGDVVIENAGEGIDTVQAQLISYSLGANVENLILTGWNVNGTGNDLDNMLAGSQGNNVLNGGLGADQMAGGKGNDTYVVDNAADVVNEFAAEGTDTIQSGVSYILGANLENLTLTGSADLDGEGNELNNILTGNNGVNNLFGDLGVDTLIGAGGNDILVGGDGADVLTGGAGADWFGLSGTLGTGADRITDFQAGSDLIVLDGTVFTALGNSVDAGELRISPWSAKAADANDYLLFVPSAGSLYYDADGNGAGAAVHIASLTGITSLDVSNFYVFFPPAP